MSTTDYLNKLLEAYSESFDISRPYTAENGQQYPAYGYFYSCIEKYVLVREANMWTSNCYEHIIFLDTDICSESTVAEAITLIKDYMEPCLVRKGQKWPDVNHMYSYLTVVIICDRIADKLVEKAIKRFRFDKGYRFHMRGFSNGRLICACMEDARILANYAAGRNNEVFKKIF